MGIILGSAIPIPTFPIQSFHISLSTIYLQLAICLQSAVCLLLAVCLQSITNYNEIMAIILQL